MPVFTKCMKPDLDARVIYKKGPATQDARTHTKICTLEAYRCYEGDKMIWCPECHNCASYIKTWRGDVCMMCGHNLDNPAEAEVCN